MSSKALRQTTPSQTEVLDTHGKALPAWISTLCVLQGEKQGGLCAACVLHHSAAFSRGRQDRFPAKERLRFTVWHTSR